MAAKSKLKKPMMGFRRDESYADAQRRWRKRLDAWRDAECMARCAAKSPLKRRRLLQAFHGLTLGDLLELD